MNVSTTTIALPRHGGSLAPAIEQYGGTLEQWTDLSTGISPWIYPIPTINNNLWRELPEQSTSLEKVAATFYKTTPERISVTPGSQLAIRIIPTLIDKQTVAIPLVGYQEHRYAWENAGHTVLLYEHADALQRLINDGSIHSAVVINPNNPTNELVGKETLIKMANGLRGLLIVDEAFVDLDQSQSVSSNSDTENLIIIRSIGKFFGLAGARIGFLIGSHELVPQLKTLFSPWSINAPAQYIAETALQDIDWQAQQTLRIRQQSSELESVLIKFIAKQKLELECRSNGLFTSLFGKHTVIKSVHHMLAENRFWSRIGDPFINSLDTNNEPHNWLRLSLPGANMDRLKHTLLLTESISS